ncbi:MAG: alpha/beta hydrolase [Bilifractor sp.]
MAEYTEVQKNMLRVASAQRVQNAEARVSGKRVQIPLDGRTIEVVYYKRKREKQSVPDTKAPLIIGLHGGGCLMGGGALNDAMWLDASKTLDADVASVDYRLTPEHRFPDAVQDVMDVSTWLIRHSDDFGFDPEKVALMGCSSGGNLAASAAILANRRGEKIWRSQILVYPYLDMQTDPVNKGANQQEKEMFDLFNEFYIDPEHAADPLVSPFFASREDLKGLPDTALIIAGRDILRHEDAAYGSMLRQAGVRVYEMFAGNMPHAYFEHAYRPVEELVFCSSMEKKLRTSGAMVGARVEMLRFLRSIASYLLW